MRFACNDCTKKFRTEGALEMHLKDKHSTKLHHVQKPRGRQIGFWGTCFAGALGGFVAAVVMIGGAAAVMLREGGIITLTTSPQMQEKAAVFKAMLPSAVIRR
jgi:hypothetical protein